MKEASILYLSYDGLTDQLGQSQILPYIIGLSKKGFKFTIISFEKQNRLDENREIIEKSIAGLDILWRPFIYHKTPPVFSTVYDVWVMHKVAQQLISKGEIRIVHCRSYITALVGLRLKEAYRIRFIFDMRGFWADERVEGGLWNLRNPLFKLIYNYFKRKERRFIEEADCVICLTQNAKNEVLSWTLNKSIDVIPCCVDLELFDPAKINLRERQKIQNDLGIASDHFVLLYLGAWGTWYMTTEMLDFFSELKTKEQNAKFLILTNDSIDLSGYPFKEDIVIKSVPRNSVPIYLSLANLALVFIKPTFSKKGSSATKMGEIMAMNVPLITNPGWGDIETIVKESSLFLYPMSISDLLSKMGPLTETRSFCIRNLSLAVGIDSYERIYRRVLVE